MSYSQNPPLYLARSISGCTHKDVFSWYAKYIKILTKIGFDVMSPLTDDEYIRTNTVFRAEGNGTAGQSNDAIVIRDRKMAKKADFMLCDLRNTNRVSIGCVNEIAWSKDAGNMVHIVMEPQNIHRHAFIIQGAIVFDNMDDALAYLSRFIKQKPKRRKT